MAETAIKDSCVGWRGRALFNRGVKMKMIHAFATLILDRLISLLLKNGPSPLRRYGVKHQNVNGPVSGLCKEDLMQEAEGDS